MLEAGENTGGVARQMSHTSAEMLCGGMRVSQVARSDGSRAEQWWDEKAGDSGRGQVAAEGPKVVEG